MNKLITLLFAGVTLTGGLAEPGLAQSPAPLLPSRMVRLRDVEPSIVQDMRYATANNFTGSVVPGYENGECVLLMQTAEALKSVQTDLRAKGLSLKVYDCFRPVRAVNAFFAWSKTPSNAKKAPYYPRTEKGRLFAEGYIARHSSHSKGSAVDAGLIVVGSGLPTVDHRSPKSCIGPVMDRVPDNGIDMGTSFDCFDPKSATANGELTPEQRANRKSLLNVLEVHGFRNYAREWWHFELTGARRARSSQRRI